MSQETHEVVLKLICNVTKRPLKDVQTTVTLYGKSDVVAEGKTDEQGEVRFNLPRGTYSVYFRFDDPRYYDLLSWFTVPSRMPIVFEAMRAATNEEVKVRVIRSETDPTPIPGATVSVTRLLPIGHGYYYPAQVVDTKKTNEQGEVVFMLEALQHYLIKSDAGDDEAIIYVLDPTSVTLTLLEKVFVIVREARTERAIPRANVIVIGRPGGIVTSDRTDENGIVVFYLERNKQYGLLVEAPGYKTPHTSEIEVTKNLLIRDVKNSFVVELEKDPSPPPSHTFTITVLDSLDNTPVSGALVRVLDSDGVKYYTLVEGYTDSQGRFSFTLSFLPSHMYKLIIQKEHFITLEGGIHEHSPPAFTIRLQRRSQTVTVRVVDKSNDRPISGVQVIVRRGQAVAEQATTNASGEVQFTLYHAITYTIHALALAAGYRVGHITDITIPLSEPVITIGLTPAPLQTFTVRVVDAEKNEALRYADVVIKHNQFTIAKGQTNESGKVQFTLPHDTYSMEVSRYYYQPKSMDITVPVPGGEITVALEGLTRQDITFRVVNAANGVPVPNAKIRVVREGKEIASGVTDEEGKWTVTLEKGLNYVQVIYDGRSMTIPIFIPNYYDTETILVYYYFYIKVVDENGNPIPGARLRMKSGGSVFPSEFYTDESGLVKMHIYSRWNELTVSKEGWKTVRKTYEYTQIGDVHDTIVLSPARLTITVRDPQGNPVSGALVKLMRGNTVVREAITS